MTNSHERTQELAELFKALGNETRLQMLHLLSRQTLCVGALALRLDITQSAVSQHLGVLRRAGLVEAEKRGYFVHYRLAKGARERCRAVLDEIIGSDQQEECSHV